MTVIQRYKQKGLTLLETVLALAVGTVIIMAVLIYYETASDSANMAATIKITGDIGNAVRAYAQSPNYTPSKTGEIDLAKLQSAGLLTAADTANPWSIQARSLRVATSGNYLGISFSNVPVQTNATSTRNHPGGICASLAKQLSNALPLPSPGTVTLGGNNYKFTISNPAGGGVKATGPYDRSKTVQGAAVCLYAKGSTGTLSIIMDLS